MGSGNGNRYGNYGHDEPYCAYGGPIAERSERFAEWGRSVEHYGRLAGYSEQRVIEKSRKFFTAGVLDWSAPMLRREY